MTDVLYKIAEIGLHASVLTLAVLALRLMFRKTPKRVSCALWGLVALRLLLPVSIQSPVSLQPDTAPLMENAAYYFSAAEETTPDTAAGEGEYTTIGVPHMEPQPEQKAKPSFFARVELPRLLTGVWLTGIVVLLLYAAFSFLLLRRRVAASLPLGGNVYETDAVSSPFLLGIFRPKIYLPCSLTDEQKAHVLAHERAHLKRGDHILKPLAFLLVSVYWFHPLLWVAYVLFNRDLELACDERVIRNYEPTRRAAYAETLLTCGSRKRDAALSPLAFGEVSVKTRVKQALSYKKPALWIVIAAALAGVVAAVCLLTVPQTGKPTGVELLAEDEAGNLNYFKILSDGTLRQKPDAPGGGYGGFAADADCFAYREENGKPTIDVVKTELHHPDGAPAPVTEDRETVFYAVAAAAKGEIRKIEIFEMPGADGSIFVAVEYKTKGGFASAVFRYDPVNKALEELCTAENIRVLDVYSTEPESAYPIGVEVIAIDSDQTDGLKTYRVFSDGSAKEIEGEAWGAYGGLFAEADCFAADTTDGKTKVTVVKMTLYDTARAQVPITAERAAIFDAAARAAAGGIVSMQIFEQQTGEQPRFVALEYAGNVTDVFRFDAAEQTLVKLCAIDGQRVLDVHTAETQTPDAQSAASGSDLEEAVRDALLADQADQYADGEYGAVGCILLGTKERGDTVTAFVLQGFSEFGFENDCFTEVQGNRMPAVLIFTKSETGYRFRELDYPGEGGYYTSSIKRLFPQKYWDRIFSHSEADNDEIWRQCVQQAQEYLTQIGRTAAVLPWGDVERTWLYDVISPEIADKLSGKTELAWYPDWIGTRERIENGVRYVYSVRRTETAISQLLYVKTTYGNPVEIQESYAVNAETGEIIGKNTVRY